jgi:plasmid stabilization system protein ParE
MNDRRYLIAREVQRLIAATGGSRTKAADLVPGSAGTREIVVRPNDVVVCRIEDDGDTVAVLRVLHAAQQCPPASQSAVNQRTA